MASSMNSMASRKDRSASTQTMSPEGMTGGIAGGVEIAGVVSLVLTVVILLYILLTFGVLLPKKVAARYPDKWAYMCIGPLLNILCVQPMYCRTKSVKKHIDQNQ